MRPDFSPKWFCSPHFLLQKESAFGLEHRCCLPDWRGATSGLPWPCPTHHTQLCKLFLLCVLLWTVSVEPQIRPKNVLAILAFWAQGFSEVVVDTFNPDPHKLHSLSINLWWNARIVFIILVIPRCQRLSKLTFFADVMIAIFILCQHLYLELLW